VINWSLLFSKFTESQFFVTHWVCSYEKERKLRVAVIHGLARMAAIMATTYRPYLGVGLGPLSVCHKLTWIRSIQFSVLLCVSASLKLSMVTRFYWNSETSFAIGLAIIFPPRASLRNCILKLLNRIVKLFDFTRICVAAVFDQVEDTTSWKSWREILH
jgi:hypothetical protein